MEYISTRDKNLSFSFKDVFLRGLAPDGGLFIPKKIRTYNQSEIAKLSNLSYTDLATEIISNFCEPEIDKNDLRKIIRKSYQNFITDDVVKIRKK